MEKQVTTSENAIEKFDFLSGDGEYELVMDVILTKK